MYIYRSAFATQRRIKNPKRELIVSSLFRFLKYVFSGLVFSLLCTAVNFDFILYTAIILCLTTGDAFTFICAYVHVHRYVF